MSLSVDSTVVTATQGDSVSSTATNFNRCCFNLSCFGPRPREWWALAGPITAFKKAREWSEIVAGPKWKTFIRRFNRKSRHHHHHHGGHGHVKFQYDPLSYALNFDDGHGQTGHFDDGVVDFSARFSAVSALDLAKVAPAV